MGVLPSRWWPDGGHSFPRSTSHLSTPRTALSSVISAPIEDGNDFLKQKSKNQKQHREGSSHATKRHPLKIRPCRRSRSRKSNCRESGLSHRATAKSTQSLSRSLLTLSASPPHLSQHHDVLTVWINVFLRGSGTQPRRGDSRSMSGCRGGCRGGGSLESLVLVGGR